MAWQDDDTGDEEEDLGWEGGGRLYARADAYAGLLAAGVQAQAAAYAADTQSAGAAAGRSFALAWAAVLARLLGAGHEERLRMSRALRTADECAPRAAPECCQLLLLCCCAPVCWHMNLPDAKMTVEVAWRACRPAHGAHLSRGLVRCGTPPQCDAYFGGDRVSQGPEMGRSLLGWWVRCWTRWCRCCRWRSLRRSSRAPGAAAAAARLRAVPSRRAPPRRRPPLLPRRAPALHPRAPGAWPTSCAAWVRASRRLNLFSK